MTHLRLDFGGPGVPAVALPHSIAGAFRTSPPTSTSTTSGRSCYDGVLMHPVDESVSAAEGDEVPRRQAVGRQQGSVAAAEIVEILSVSNSGHRAGQVHVGLSL